MTNPVLIVGAGPVGLTMAAALHHQGLACRIIDKAPVPSDKSKALAVWCRTLELLDGLGLADTFVQTGLKLSGGSMYADGKRLVHLHLTSDESRYGFPLMVPQNVTERLLTEHLTRVGVKVERPVELVSFAEIPDGFRCTLRLGDGGEEVVETPWLIGCDGAHSAVRHGLGLEFTGHAEPNDWMLADAQIDGPLARDEVSIFWHDRGVVAFFPIDHSRFRLIADVGPASDSRPAELTLADAQKKLDECGPGNLTLRDPVWLSYFRINERKVSDYRQGRAFLAGDAAHIHSPAGGQGMNTGMQDAFNLAWKLALVETARGKAEPLLQSYSVERSEVGDQVLKNAERFTTMATLRNPVARWMRNHIAPIVGSLDAVQNKIRQTWFELSINYRHSPISGQKWPALTGGLHAGDRLCEVALTSHASGKSTTVFQAIRSSGHKLLLLPGTGASEKLWQCAAEADRAFPGIFSKHLILKPGVAVPATGLPEMPVWIDADGELHKELHATSPTLIVVRPDEYIAFRCQPADPEEMMGFLTSYLVTSAG
ncbi:MAG TPA: FAD-dependent monooxygenase [Planctomycetaceae bacterium]|nr:FAD-dependent monooxygenase [Planctomycetaceae bacterium]